MEKLARDGYVPVTAREFATGKMDIPAGKHPVVLTFDDGHPSHFALDEKGMPVANTAVGIIYQVARKYPDFRPVATFWVNQQPFGLRSRADQARAVQWLTSRGFEVANHTWSHPALPGMSKKRIAEQLVRVERMLEALGAGPSETLALPFGAMPHPRSSVQRGKWDGTRFGFKGSSSPARSRRSRPSPRPTTGGPSSGSRATARRASVGGGARSTGWSG
nr:hypothetical protein GCM10020093_116510 [Planobispora longispora]